MRDELFIRHVSNPILTCEDWPYSVHTVFNPGATRLPSGETVLLVRCEDFRGISHMTVARSVNGFDDWKIDAQPSMIPDPEGHPEEEWGLEDPRITWVEDQQLYGIAYTAYSRNGPSVSLATTTDFQSFQRIGLVMQPDDKDAALFPRKIRDEYVMVHRPMTVERADMWLSYSQDLTNWGRPTPLLKARRGAWWDANKIGLCCPPVETSEGWLIFYHGVRHHASGSLYRVGVALAELEQPENIIVRSEPWMFGPNEPYERVGDVPNVVFPTGFTIGDDGDTLNMYYGCADTSIGVATGSLRHILDWLKRNGT